MHRKRRKNEQEETSSNEQEKESKKPMGNSVRRGSATVYIRREHIPDHYAALVSNNVRLLQSGRVEGGRRDMITVNDFILQEIKARIDAAKIFNNPIRVNGISIRESYDAQSGIQVDEGLEEIAKLYGEEVRQDVEPGERITVIRKSITLNGVKLYSVTYEVNKDV